MTSAVVNLTEQNDRFINIVKAHRGLKNKSDAINFVVQEYSKEASEPQVRPEYIRKLKKIMKGKTHAYRSLDEMFAGYK